MSAPAAKRRGRGRPRSAGEDDQGVVTRDDVVELAFELGRTASLDEISYAELARRLGVVPGSLHYHVGTKDELTSLVLNRFYRELLEALPRHDGRQSWRTRIARFSTVLMECERSHRGAAEHIQRHARYRVFQKVGAGETDYGALFLDRAFAMFRDAGFTPQQTALYYHVLAMHCLASANADAGRLEPATHEAFLRDKAASIAHGDAAGLGYALEAFAGITTEEAFALGLEALLDRFAAERPSQP